MINVNVANEDLFITWKHERVENPTKFDVTTTCTVKCGDETVATGIANKSIGDQHVKEFGRKLSLTRALQTLTEPLEVKNARAFRRTIWNAYLNRSTDMSHPNPDCPADQTDDTCCGNPDSCTHDNADTSSD